MPDVLKRFVPTPVESAFELHGATVRVATNCRLLADRLLRAFGRSTRGVLNAPAVAWRVVVEPDDTLEVAPESLDGHRLSHGGLAFVTIGPKNFLACDLQGREGVAFISLSLAHDEKLFQQYFLPALVSLLNESLQVPLCTS